ncbi:ScyD/ScyE family protein [Arthrobacter humicola]
MILIKGHWRESAGRLTRVLADGSKSTVYSAPDWDVAGTAERRSTLYLLESQGAGPMDDRPLAGHIRAISDDGTQWTFGDFASLESNENADGGTRYGFRNLPAECAAQLPAGMPPASYTGDVDSHPYSIALSGRTAYVADAGANSVVSVDLRSGDTETVAGLYVTTLPGGPEDPRLGARGSVYKVNPDNGRVRLFADDALSPTGLALDDDGDIYVASLFGNGVLRINGDDGQRTVLTGKLTADVSIRDSKLYASTDALPAPNQAPDGKLVSIDLDGHSRH